MKAKAESYTKYAALFLLLQFVDILAAGKAMRISMFLMLEMFGLCGIGLVLWGIYLCYHIRSDLYNRDIYYGWLLKQKYIDEAVKPYTKYNTAWRSVISLLEHPEIGEDAETGRVFWGWMDDGTFEVRSDGTLQGNDRVCARRIPKTSTEQKNVVLQATAWKSWSETAVCGRTGDSGEFRKAGKCFSEADAEESGKAGKCFSEADAEESGKAGKCFSEADLEEAVKNRRIDYENQIVVYPVFMDREDRVADWSREKTGFALTWDMLDMEDTLYTGGVQGKSDGKEAGREQSGSSTRIFGKAFEQACLNYLAEETGLPADQLKCCRVGIVSVFQDTAAFQNTAAFQAGDGIRNESMSGDAALTQDEAVPEIGMLVFVQLEQESERKLSQHMGRKNVDIAFLSEDAMMEKALEQPGNVGKTPGTVAVQTAENTAAQTAENAAEQAAGNAVTQYMALMYLYSKKNRFAFAERLIAKQPLPLWGKFLAERFADAVNRKQRRKVSIRLFLRRSIYRILKSVTESPVNIILLMLAFLLENVIEPFTTESMDKTPGWENVAAVLEGAGLLTTGAIIGAVFVVWLIILFISRGKKVSAWMKNGGLAETHAFDVIGKNQNLFLPENMIDGWDGDRVKVSLSKDSCRLPEELTENFLTDSLREEKNDGTKYRMIGYRDTGDLIHIIVNSCKYTETMQVQNAVKARRGITGDWKGTKETAELLCSRFEEQILNLKDRSKAINRDFIPPNSLCMHAVILTKDDYLVWTRRDQSLSYYGSAFDCSAEEQLNMEDFDKDGARIQNWAERLLKEEFGISAHNCGGTTVGDIRVLSVFFEKDVLNIALAVKIRLHLKKRELEAILNDWPRKDYEFEYRILTWEEVSRDFAENQDKYHATVKNRLFLAACSEMRFELAENFGWADSEGERTVQFR